MDRRHNYLLNPDHSVEPVDVSTEAGLIAWALAWGAADRRVAYDEISPGIWVSTVFLGIDHNWSAKGPPILFETMAFNDYGDQDCRRWASWDEAQAGHRIMVDRLKTEAARAGLCDFPTPPQSPAKGP